MTSLFITLLQGTCQRALFFAFLTHAIESISTLTSLLNCRILHFLRLRAVRLVLQRLLDVLVGTSAHSALSI